MAPRRFVPLTLSAVAPETDSAVTLTFATDGAGDAFQFTPGQHISIRTSIDGQDIRRSYSICDPAGGALRVLVKQVPNGVFSRHARTALAAGDTLDVMPPIGNFAAGIDYRPETQVCGIAAGSGITPIISVIETALNAGGSATLIYGSRHRDGILFRDRIAALKDRHLARFAVYHILSQEKTDNPLFHGRIDAPRLQQLFKLFDQRGSHILLCGPAEMMDSAEPIAREHAASVHREFFNAPTTADAPPPSSISASAGDSAANIAATATIRLDGIAHKITIRDGDTILQAAQRAGLETPYACSGGVCGTCRAALTSGSARMDINHALEPDERARGVILSCQARPTSKELDVSFDL